MYCLLLSKNVYIYIYVKRNTYLHCNILCKTVKPIQSSLRSESKNKKIQGEYKSIKHIGIAYII